jgi:hypothetical protein
MGFEKMPLADAGRPRYAGNEPCFSDWPAERIDRFEGAMSVLDAENLVAGYPGMIWLPPRDRFLRHRNVRLSPHPAKPGWLLAEPLPSGIHEARWATRDLRDPLQGTGIYFRGRVRFLDSECAIERLERSAKTANETEVALGGHAFAC